MKMIVCAAVALFGTIAAMPLAASPENERPHPTPFSNGDDFTIDENLVPTQLVFVGHDAAGRIEFLIPRAAGVSDSTWKATAAWVGDNRSRLDSVLADAMADAPRSADSGKTGEIPYLNARLQEWMATSGAYVEIALQASGASVQSPHYANVHHDTKCSDIPVCDDCAAFQCWDFRCACFWAGDYCCIINP